MIVCMLREVAEQLDRWLIERDFEARQEGLLRPKPCTIRVVGQTALFESGLELTLASTKDVDVKADYEHAVQVEFERLLAQHGRMLDPSGHEAWMPKETRYRPLFGGRFVELLVADPEAVLLSKALKAPAKNQVLLTEYLARGASERFFELAEAYALDLEQFA